MEIGSIRGPDPKMGIQALESTEAVVDTYNSTLEGWQVAVVVVVAVCCLVAAAGATLWCVTHRRKDNSKRQEFNRKMSRYYDSISIDENFSKLNYELFNSESEEGTSTISTQVSTPVSPRADNQMSSVHAQSFKISNGKLPSIHFQSDYKFSLEDTMKKLKELDSEDNIAQIRNTYRYMGEMDDISLEEDIESLDTSSKDSPRFRYLDSDQPSVMDTLPFIESTYL